jgi:hypothetical protein
LREPGVRVRRLPGDLRAGGETMLRQWSADLCCEWAMGICRGLRQPDVRRGCVRGPVRARAIAVLREWRPVLRTQWAMGDRLRLWQSNLRCGGVHRRLRTRPGAMLRQWRADLHLERDLGDGRPSCARVRRASRGRAVVRVRRVPGNARGMASSPAGPMGNGMRLCLAPIRLASMAHAADPARMDRLNASAMGWRTAR